MRIFKWLIALCLIGGALYLVSPFYAAWTLHRAVVTADTQTLRDKVDWPAVRHSLRESIAAYSDLLPAARRAAHSVRPSIWQRIKSAFGYSMLDRFIDAYITPEGLPKLHGLHERGRGLADGVRSARPGFAALRDNPQPRALPLPPANLSAEEKALLRDDDGSDIDDGPEVADRAARSPTQPKSQPTSFDQVTVFLKRVRRAAFLNPFSVEIVVRDRRHTDRFYVSRLDLRGTEWILADLRVIREDPLGDA